MKEVTARKEDIFCSWPNIFLPLFLSKSTVLVGILNKKVGFCMSEVGCWKWKWLVIVL